MAYNRSEKSYNRSEKKSKGNGVSHFPIKSLVVLAILLIAQIIAICFAFLYYPEPQDIIKSYVITVEPSKEGKLDVLYNFSWQAVDSDEPLTWVDIGMPNSTYRIFTDYYSKNIDEHGVYVDGDYCAERLVFDREYIDGEIVDFQFNVYIDDMLCKDDEGYFYEFIPSWFNSIPIEHYEFRWKADNRVISAEGAELRDGYYVWSGSMECGEYRKMLVRYTEDAFEGEHTVKYIPFDDSDVYDDTRSGVIALGVFVALILIIPEVYMIDCYVSYKKGRGFLSGYGHRIHVHGRYNPHYVTARRHHMATQSSSGRGGFSGGGCACACACACAGGGRAGCSQKDTYTNTKE